ncbi:MAG: matrixin family metalloprotease [Pseudomonadota bacterium]
MCDFCEAKWQGGDWGTPGGEVSWRFAEVGEGGGDVTGALTGAHAARTREAFDAWESVIDLDFQEVAPGEDADIVLGWGDVDGPYGVIGFARTTSLGDALIGSVIIIDDDDRWSVDRAQPSSTARGEWNFYAVMAHEIGHAIGLPHLEERTSLMHASSLAATDLTLADVRAAVALYGPARQTAGTGDDVLAGGAGEDVLRGGAGDDRLHAFGGADLLSGGRGDDRLSGGAGDDDLRGGGGRDALIGGRGADALSGGAGRDRLTGGGGEDRLDGGRGADMLRGGGGADVFVFAARGGRDVVRDWTDGRDRIELAGGGRFREIEMTREGGDLLLRWKSAEMLLEGAADERFTWLDVIA